MVVVPVVVAVEATCPHPDKTIMEENAKTLSTYEAVCLVEFTINFLFRVHTHIKNPYVTTKTFPTQYVSGFC